MRSDAPSEQNSPTTVSAWPCVLNGMQRSAARTHNTEDTLHIKHYTKQEGHFGQPDRAVDAAPVDVVGLGIASSSMVTCAG